MDNVITVLIIALSVGCPSMFYLGTVERTNKERRKKEVKM